MPKEPKIIQFGINEAGKVMSVLYDDGRIFEQYLERAEVPHGVRFVWIEMKPPIPRIPIPPETARRSAWPKTKRK